MAQRFLDGEAGGGDRGEFDRHLNGCAECARLFSELRILAAVHAGLGGVAPPEGMTERIVAASRAARGRAASSGAGRRWVAIVAAAAAAVFLLGIYAGSFISRSYLQAAGPRYAEVTGLEYLDDYPPASLGEAMEVASGGAKDE